MNTPCWIALLCSGGACVYKMGKIICHRIQKFKSLSKRSKEAINEVLIYGSENKNQAKEIKLNNLLCLNYLVLSARRSVEMCLPSLGDGTLDKHLVSILQENKLKFRIIIHNSDVNKLRLSDEIDVEIKYVNSIVPIAHDFLLIDATDEYLNAVAVMGAVKAETARGASVITSEINVVRTLKREFDRVWNSA